MSTYLCRSSLLLCIALGASSPAHAAEAQAKTTGSKAQPTQLKGSLTKTKAEPKPTAPRLTVAQIVKKHVTARGGQQAWQAVQALSASGKMDAGTGDSVSRSMSVVKESGPRKLRHDPGAGARKEAAGKQVQLPFRLAKERPNRSRLEIEFAGKTAVQVYDGQNGWKVRPYLNRSEVEPFTPQEAKAEAETPGLDGLLVGYEAKGTKVELEGVDRVEGRDAYKLKVTARSGIERRVWIDAKSFLDVKVEGVPRRLDGKLHPVFVYQRDFRTVLGVKIPFVMETVVDGYPQSHKIQFEKVAVNPKLDAATFAKPKA